MVLGEQPRVCRVGFTAKRNLKIPQWQKGKVSLE